MTETDRKDQPDPGTTEAIDAGCTCPKTKDQPYRPTGKMPPRWDLDWMCVRPHCPIHGWRTAIRRVGEKGDGQ